MPRVSVIMPTYNAGSRIGAAISGALSQRHDDVELIVVDDGSTDDTVEIARGFGDRLVLIQQANAGPNAARNTGLHAATGEVIALCDSDDFLLPNYVADALEQLEAAPPRTWVTCSSQLLTDRGLEPYGYSYFGEVAREEQREAILQVNFVSIFSVFPKQMADEIGLFDERLHRAEDWEYWARALFSGWRVAYQPRVASLYRRQGHSQSSDIQSMLDSEDAMIEGLTERFASTFTERERQILRARAEGGSAQRRRLQAIDAWTAGRFSESAALLSAAARAFPSFRGLGRKAMVARAIAPVLERMPEGSRLRRGIQKRWQ